MQPTLYGITHENLGGKPNVKIPGRIARFGDYWIHGISYFHETAPTDGRVEAIKRPVKFLLFNLKQEYRFGGVWRTIWFPVDDLFARAGLVSRNGDMANRTFRVGEDLFKLKVIAGDHLFVNRMKYNFSHPRRGDIIVFSTRGFDPQAALAHGVAPNQYYIKRLVASGGERVRIGDDQHLIINGRRLDSSTPHFEGVYHFRPNAGDNEYFGHLQTSLLADASMELLVRTNHYMVMGDNTRSSLDSRYIGDFSRDQVIGKSSFVYWPISERFGFGYR
jgi:signal peptidase I